MWDFIHELSHRLFAGQILFPAHSFCVFIMFIKVSAIYLVH